MGKGRGSGREWVKVGMDRREMGMHEKIAPKRNILAFRDAHWGLPPRIVHVRKLFSRATFACIFNR